MTSGGNRGPSGGWLARLPGRPEAITAVVFAAFGFVYMVVNAASLIDQRRTLGRPIAAAQAWLLEGTSYLAWLMLLPLILFMTSRLARRGPWAALLGHVAACLLVSLIHSGTMGLLRVASFSMSGLEYAAVEPLADRLLFELRKDIITYVSIVAVCHIARRLLETTATFGAPSERDRELIEVRDGSRVVFLRPNEIDWVGAAGNYVELHGPFGSELARRTMADISSELEPHGFVRVHRSRLVRRAAIATINTRQSGDFDMQLTSGFSISGSRRFRQNLH